MAFFVPETKRGFLLVEIVVVAAIVAILATVATVNIMESHRKTNDTKRIADIGTLQLALRVYKDAVGDYPAGFDEGVVIGEGGLLDTELQSYLTGTVVDPIASGNYEYVYDSDYDDCAPAVGQNKKVLYARNMEQPSSTNWADICGAVLPGENTYGVILH
jgi:prepilin-type N-terminal cleavage/methylation domain-containing protein